ncbi:hypothetical protein PMAYCL1PPCAC_08250 [Pristionchus mayeri]|uniref:Uncharacterized protein n=1 Tax=Pristionchus mayeri TaxID=1317129 RepID=A0AAN4ZJD2_9BILA|nr:hypothetical protein PMAYCL1PPCAC_08250 [Pristionchus mayeri]
MEDLTTSTAHRVIVGQEEQPGKHDRLDVVFSTDQPFLTPELIVGLIALFIVLLIIGGVVAWRCFKSTRSAPVAAARPTIPAAVATAELDPMLRKAGALKQ